MKPPRHKFDFQGQYAKDRFALEAAKVRAEEVVQAVLLRAEAQWQNQAVPKNPPPKPSGY